ncbi:hypothetical protein D3C71_1310370 [compost metagenome]
MSVRQLLHIHRIIQILRIFPVDRNDNLVAQVAPILLADLFLFDDIRSIQRLRQHFFREGLRQLMLADNG